MDGRVVACAISFGTALALWSGAGSADVEFIGVMTMDDILVRSDFVGVLQMSPTQATGTAVFREPAAYLIGGAVGLAIVAGCGRDARGSSAEALRTATLARLDEGARAAIASLPPAASSTFDFERGSPADGSLVLRVTDDDDVRLVVGAAVEGMGPVVAGEIRVDPATATRLAGGAFTGWVDALDGSYLRGVVGEEGRSWRVRRYALEVDAAGLYVLTVELPTEGAATEALIARGRLVGYCDSVSEDGVVRRETRPARGSLCEEVVGWL